MQNFWDASIDELTKRHDKYPEYFNDFDRLEKQLWYIIYRVLPRWPKLLPRATLFQETSL